MAFIQWDNSLSVGVAEIDKQHQKLVQLINDLGDAMKQGKGQVVMGGILNELVTYTQVHFGHEEKYFVQFQYPETYSHKQEHAAFVKKATELKDGFEKGQIGLSLQVMDFLCDWLKKHIKGTDQKYSKFFNDKGLK
jgi:hemerythrin